VWVGGKGAHKRARVGRGRNTTRSPRPRQQNGVTCGWWMGGFRSLKRRENKLALAAGDPVERGGEKKKGTLERRVADELAGLRA